MAREISDREKLFRAAFTKDELKYLRRIDEFATEMERPITTLADFERVARLGNELLAERDRRESRL